MLINPKRAKDNVVQWIRGYFEESGPKASAVIGISGGKDSTVAAALCVEALGKNRVLGVLMPNGYQPDEKDALRVVKELGIPFVRVDIARAYVALAGAVECTLGRASDQAKINLPPRIRMATLYAIAQSIPGGGRVVNTCNLSEDYVGYSTKFGDTVGDFSPLGEFLVHEVLQLGQALGLPDDLVFKTPSDGLCGKTDEDNLGFSYDDLDIYIMTGLCADPAVKAKIDALHERNLHKLLPMPVYQART